MVVGCAGHLRRIHDSEKMTKPATRLGLSDKHMQRHGRGEHNKRIGPEANAPQIVAA